MTIIDRTKHPLARNTLTNTLVARLSAHGRILELDLPGLVPCAEACGDPIRLGGINGEDFTLFRDPDKLRLGVLEFEFYHTDCALRAYGEDAIPR